MQLQDIQELLQPFETFSTEIRTEGCTTSSSVQSDREYESAGSTGFNLWTDHYRLVKTRKVTP